MATDVKKLRAYVARLRVRHAEVSKELRKALRGTGAGGIFYPDNKDSKAAQMLKSRDNNLFEQKMGLEASISETEKKIKRPKEKLKSLSRRGSAGGGGGNLASRGRSRSLLQQIKDASGPLNE